MLPSSWLSSALSSLITRYLGSFVDLPASNLSVGLASGRVDVRDLRFKSDSLRDLNLPITVREGVLGHLLIAIPWTSIWTSPTQVVLEDVYLLAESKV